MALATRICVSSIPGPTLTTRSKSKKCARISLSSAISRKDAGEKLYNIGTLRTIQYRQRKPCEWVLQASGENEVVSTEEKSVVADSTKNVEQNSSGPPVLTIIAGLVVLAGFLWAAGSVLLWFIGLFFR